MFRIFCSRIPKCIQVLCFSVREFREKPKFRETGFQMSEYSDGSEILIRCYLFSNCRGFREFENLGGP